MNRKLKAIVGVITIFGILILLTSIFFGVIYNNRNLPISKSYFSFINKYSPATILGIYSASLAIYLTLIASLIRIIAIIKAIFTKPTIVNNVLIKEPKNDVIYSQNKNYIVFNHVNKTLKIRFTKNSDKGSTINLLIKQLSEVNTI